MPGIKIKGLNFKKIILWSKFNLPNCERVLVHHPTGMSIFPSQWKVPAFCLVFREQIGKGVEPFESSCHCSNFRHLGVT
jgi:hypothetical protein